MRTGIEMIKAERDRQIKEEGWTPEHDDMHVEGELAEAAACYAVSPALGSPPLGWPWHPDWWKPTTKLRMLVKAGALIAAEIDRLLRKENQ